jgi:hypothetical protein
MCFCQFSYLETVTHHRIVANHAFIGARKSSLLALHCPSVTLRAGQADSGMLLVTEVDWLPRDGEGQLLLFSFIDGRLLTQRDKAPQTKHERGEKHYFCE